MSRALLALSRPPVDGLLEAVLAALRRRHLAWLAGSIALGLGLATAPLRGQIVEPPGQGYMAPRPLVGGGAAGAMPNSYPLATYYYPFASYYDGQYAQALDEFRNAKLNTRKVPGPWLDSVCHHAMLGECHYQLGRLSDALSEYTTALQISAAYPHWLDRVQFAEVVNPVGTGRYARTPWGQSRRNPTLGYFPASTAFLEGNVDNTQAVVRGGVVQAPQLLSVNVYEIVRGSCLALRRRAELMGPLGESDPFNQQLIEQYLQTQRDGWPRFLIEIPLALAYRAAGKSPQAQAVLERSITCGDFDHPFTGLVLFELGQLAREGGNHARAADYFEEAAIAAAQYDDADTIEACFQELLGLERMVQGQRDFPSLARAADWAGTRELRKLRVMLLLNAAERAAHAGETDDARTLVDQADQLVARRDLRTARGGARLNWVRALVDYQHNQLADGDDAVDAAIEWQQQGSPRQFQLYWLGHLLEAEEMSARNALAIYDRLLREPDGAEWIRDPLEALTAWATPQAAHFEQWFLLAWDRQRAEEQSQLVEIADRARRHQFLSALELGGRPQALAWLLAAAPEQLSPELKLQRQDLLLRFPEFERARQQARPLRDAFAKLIGGNETERRRTHDELVSQLAQHTAAEQRALRELALRREPAGIVFPPIRATPEVQRALPDKHAILAYFTAQGRTFGFLITRQKYQVWEVGPQAKISEGVAGILKSWYLVNGQRALSAAEATDQRWKKRAGVLLPYLTAGAQTDFPASLSLEEITIVPDGALWYLPFEALECGSGAKAQPLISVAKLRYTPTVGLAVDRIDDAQPVDRTVALFGRLASRDDEALMAETLAEFERVAPGAVGWRRPISEASAVAATVAGRVIVLDSLPLEGKDAFGWSPLGLNHGETETTVLDWLRLPWPAPREVLLPSFHTAAETALQHDSVAPDGSELFLATTALIGAGARTIVLARWRTGGATVADELREFVQELPFSTPAEAWQRSLLLCMRNPLDPARERRLNWKSREPPPRAEHPFYWAAPLLIHCGIPASQAPEVDPFAAPGAPPAD